MAFSVRRIARASSASVRTAALRPRSQPGASTTKYPRRWATSAPAANGRPAREDIAVGELEGAKFRVEPLRRTGEDPKTMRARLLCA